MDDDELVLISSSGLNKEEARSLNAYLGISFSMTKYFSRQRMRRYFQWAGAHLSDLLVIVADHFEGYNFQVFKNLPPEISFEKAYEVGLQFAKSYSRAIPPTLASRVKVVLASELLKEDQCAMILALASELAQKNRDFKADVYSAILELLSGKIKAAGYQGPRREIALDILQQYVLEEIAIILYVAHRATPAYPVAIFPYPPRSVITNIYNGHYGNWFGEIIHDEPFRFVQVAPLNVDVLQSSKVSQHIGLHEGEN